MTYHVDVPIDGILATTAKALALEKNLAEAHAARGVAFSAAQRYDEAKAEFDRAIALDPNAAETFYFYARSNFAQGKLERAAELFERASAADPEDYQSPCLLVAVYRSLGRLEDAQRAAKRGVELAEQELARHPEDSRPAQIGSGALFELGEKERAMEWTARAIAIDPDDLVAQYNAACSYSRGGNVEVALDWLERCLPNLGHEKVKWAKHDADLEPLRNHPRYQKLFERLDRD
jgi:adenylate cyclase